MTEDLLTVAQAAARLGVPERTLRHVLKRPEYAAQTRQETRQTRTGTRQSTLLPAALLANLSQHFEKWDKPAEDGTDKAAETGQDAANTAEREHGATALVAYQMVVSEKDARLAEAHARIADLQAALEHEREQSRRLVEALAREQTLRALPPVPVETTRQEAAQTPQNPAEAHSSRKFWEFWKR